MKVGSPRHQNRILASFFESEGLRTALSCFIFPFVCGLLDVLPSQIFVTPRCRF